jgi:galactokinase
MLKQLASQHSHHFGKAPEVLAFAPGRVNFIGEHTDYSGGLVMPLALSMGIFAAASRTDSGLLRIQSLDFSQYGEFDLKTLAPDKKTSWANCPKGMVQMFLEEGFRVPGMDITLSGDLPVGAGLSSSAAAEVVVGVALRELFGFDVKGMRLALLAQKAEHTFTGTQCGIMDLAISVLGKKDALLKLSCRDLSYEHIPYRLKGVKLLIVNTGVKHDLATGEYNVRRRQCMEGFTIATGLRPDMKSLSDFSVELLKRKRALFPEVTFRRCRHVLGENQRVLDVAQSLEREDFETVGRLLVESHQSLRKDYEVSSEELDFLVDHALTQSGVYGARMTGGGFGGCIIVLLKESSAEAYKRSLDGYRKAFGIIPQVYEAKASEGAKRL